MSSGHLNNITSSRYVHFLSCAFCIRVSRGKAARHCWILRRMRQSGVVRCGNNTDEVDDGPLQEPQYYSYTDPNTGEPSPTFGARTPLPDMEFWGEDMVRIKRTAQASTPAPSSSISEQQQPSTPSAQRRQTFTSSRRKLKNVEARKAREEEINKLDEEEGEELSEAEAEQSSASLERNGEDEDEDFDEEDEGGGRMGKTTEEDEAQNPEMGLREIQQETGIGPSSQAPLSNDELWWNWKKPPVGQEPWSAWQKRMGDSDTVMAAAMAKRGQIKLFGDTPTIAEATLARARKRVFYDERMQAEEERRKEIGALAYYKEWVKAWPHDTSKEAVQQHYELTGEDESEQLLNMMRYQTHGEYKHMMGTDIRIRRDPLTMRMTEEEIKQVWGGDPVYPTINYVQDPDAMADYRGANFHEPVEDIIDTLRESGRLITQEEIQKLQAMEKAQELELNGYDDGMTAAVDIGDKDDDDEDEDEDDDANDDSDEDEEDKLPVTGRLEKPTSTAKSPLMYNFDLFEDADAQVLDESDEEESDADTDEQKD
ncbi:unnamed protein product [Sphagnum balticum]